MTQRKKSIILKGKISTLLRNIESTRIKINNAAWARIKTEFNERFYMFTYHFGSWLRARLLLNDTQKVRSCGTMPIEEFVVSSKEHHSQTNSICMVLFVFSPFLARLSYNPARGQGPA